MKRKGVRRILNICICTLKSWNIRLAELLKERYKDKYNINIVSVKEQLSINLLNEFKPDYIFFPHWSYIIPKEIFEKYVCIVFHMTDLPFGRGGSPLQNLIIRGIKQTKISALKVVQELDAGPIYLKNDLMLSGTAEEIYIRASEIIFKEMIPTIIQSNIKPVNQVGEVVEFKRRKVSESEITSDMSLEKIYDHIRMLDAEGYPHSYINFGDYKLILTRPSFKDGKIIADIVIEEGKHEQGTSGSGSPG